MLICRTISLAKHYNNAAQLLLNKRSLSINIAIVGSGPAGFYTTQKLLKHPDTRVDIFEKLPVPFGLVRYGVAPDHADVKNVMNSFTAIANHERVNFFGNVSLGQSISLDELLGAYHAVVLCYGSAQDKLLNIEGEASDNTLSARNFVGWYNGLPEDKELKVNLDCDTACIIGHGNVALDCARILLRPANLEKTDIAGHAQQAIARSRIRRIYIVGRRGPAQVSFSAKELRELIRLNSGYNRLEPQDVFSMVGLEDTTKLPRHRRRLVELISQVSASGASTNFARDDRTECVFKFLSQPSRIVANPDTNLVERVEFQRAVYDSKGGFLDQNAQPRLVDEFEGVDCGLVIRSIGYKAVMIDDKIPQNRALGCILNSEGRVHGYRSLYCSGWLATGAVGVIAGTLNSSQVTANSILEDIRNGKLPNLRNESPGSKLIKAHLAQRKIQVVHFNDWLRIDEFERRLGDSKGKTREKLVDVGRMLEIARGNE